MYINVNLQAVRAVARIVENARSMLVTNYNHFSTDIHSNLSEWNDANVHKFLQQAAAMTATLQEVIMRLNGIENFCREGERLIIAYNG